MPIKYERDDVRRLITVLVTKPFAIEEIIGSFRRQMAEGASAYAAVNNLRFADLPTDAEAEQLRVGIRALGDERPSGQMALRVAPRPDQFKSGQGFVTRAVGLVNLEVCVTLQQFEAWLGRNARSGGSSR